MNLERLDHHPLAAGRGERLPPADAQLLARCVRDIDRLVGRGQKERSIGLAKPFQRLQMPEVILVGVDGSLARQQVERGQLQVGQRFDRPAVAAVGVDIATRHVGAVAIALQERCHLRAALCSLGQGVHCLRQHHTGRRADRGILPAQEVLGLGRPGQQFAVQADPVCRQLSPEVGLRQPPLHLCQQHRLQGGIVEEAATGARVADADTGV